MYRHSPKLNPDTGIESTWSRKRQAVLFVGSTEAALEAGGIW